MNRESRQLAVVNALYALMPVLLLLVPRLLGKAELTAYGAGYNAYMMLVEFGVIVLPTLLYFLTPWGRPVARWFWGSRPSASILLVIPLAFCAYFLVNGVTVVWMLFLQLFGATALPQSVPVPQSGAQLGWGLLVIALTPALCEEFFFRGTLQPMLSRHLPPWAAIVLGGCMFGLIHGQLAALPGHVLLGIGLCLVAWWTRSIWYTALWHLIQNGIAVVISFASNAMLEFSRQMTGMEAADMLSEQPLAMLMSACTMLIFFGIGTACFMILLWYCTKSRRAQPVQRADERVHLLAWGPLIVALACIVYMYVTSGAAMLGGGV